MTNDEPRRPWRECKTIAEALSPPPLTPEQIKDKQRGQLLAQLADMGDKGALLAQRLRDANGGPIDLKPGELPPELLQLLHGLQP